MPINGNLLALDPNAAMFLPVAGALILALLAYGCVRLAGWVVRNERAMWMLARRWRPLMERIPGIRALERRFPPLLRFLRARVSAGEYLGLHLAVGVVLCVGALLLFTKVLLAVLDREDLTFFDRDVARVLYRAATPPGVEFWGFVSHFGTYPVMTAFAAVIGALLWRRGDRLFLPATGIALLGASLLNSELKLLVRRARPFWETPFAVESTFSFPSGHSLGAVVGYGMIAYGIYLLSRRQSVWLPVAVGLLALCVAIGYSRMYLGVHFFSDVIGGFALGIFWLAFCCTGLAVAHRRSYLKRRMMRQESRQRSRRVA